MLYQIAKDHWLILPIVLTAMGSAVKVVAQERANISTLDLEPMRSFLRPTNEIYLPKLESLSTKKNLTNGEDEGKRPSKGQEERGKIPQLSSLQNEEQTFTLSNNTLSTDFTLSQVPTPITPRPPEQPTPTLPPIREEPLRPTPSTPPIAPNRPDIPGTITIEKFEFVGNTAFSKKELAEVTKTFTGRPITFAELLQVEAAVSKKYTDAGYINSGAVIPANQTLTPLGAVVKIQIIEGGVEDIKVTGTRRLNPNYVRSRLRIATSEPLNRERLLKALQLLQLDPLIKNISAELSAGSRPELSLLEVRVQEADSFHTDFFADNGRTPSVGSFRRGVRINEGNLLGFGDSASLSYTNTDGSNAFDFSYTVPINPHNGTIKLATGLDDTNVVEPPFDRIDITGNSRYYELSFRQPIILTPIREVALGLTASRQESATKLLGVEYPLSAGADDNGKTRISALRFFQEWTQRSPQQIFAVRSQFSLGLGVFDATVSEKPPDSRFFSWRGQAQYVRLLAPDSLLVLRSDAQLATRALVPLEQFGLGGLRSVRGYRQDILLTDNAVFASAEIRLPIYRARKLGGVLQLAPFVDFGVGWNSSGGTVPGNNTLVGIGLGLQWQMGNQLTARFDYGMPLIEVNSGEKRTLQEQGLYFSLSYSPF